MMFLFLDGFVKMINKNDFEKTETNNKKKE